MKFKVQVLVESDSGNTEVVQEVMLLERGTLQPENLGLTLAEGKALLEGVQLTLVEQQVSEYQKQRSVCSDCGQKLLHKDKRTIVYRTPFGKLHLPSSRLFHCACQKQPTRSFSPLANLLPERTSPELLYLQSKFASLMSYGLTVKLLEEVLPIEGKINAATIRNNLQLVAQRVEDELGEEKEIYIEGCESEWERLPRPDLPLTVGLDGGYVRSCKKSSRNDTCFEVIVGKSVTAEGVAKRFGFVYSYDTKPKRRLYEVLKSQGMQMNQQVTFMSDGGDTVRELQFYLNPQAEYLLDWFHITMRLTVLNQMARGLSQLDEPLGTDLIKTLTRIKWFLWHGNVFKALQLLEWLVDDVEIIHMEALENNPPEADVEKLLKTLQGFQTYIFNNANFIPNYGERRRYGEAISTAFVESTVNQVISKRFVKKQQMRWSPRGAHLLLQVRTLLLNGDLRHQFERWYSFLKLETKASAN